MLSGGNRLVWSGLGGEQNLQARQRKGPLTVEEASELKQMEIGQEAFERILPKLRSAKIWGLRDIPRVPRGPKEAGRFNFYFPSLVGATPEDLAQASTWLSHRDPKDWSALKLAGLSAAGTIERWLLLLPSAATPPEDPASELRLLIRKLYQACDRDTAAALWSSRATLATSLTDQEVIPVPWHQEICKALEDSDWHQARAALESLLERVRPGPSKAKRPRPSPFRTLYLVAERT
jgi:hypothetical protein